MNNYQVGMRSINPTLFTRVEIGARPICEYKEDNSLKNNILTFVYILKSVVKFFILLLAAPFFILFLINRIGLRKTIKIFKRINKNYKQRYGELK